MNISVTKLFSILTLAVLLTLTLFAPGHTLPAVIMNADAAPAISDFTPLVVVLNNGDSYDFSTATTGSYTGGDLYLSGLKFWANNAGQRGIIDEGDMGTMPLYFADLPDAGYTRFGVDVVLGHTYVSLAQAGEEGNFIAFRVTAIAGQAVTIEYLYLNPHTITLADGNSYDFTSNTIGSFTGGDLYFYQQKFWANNSGQRGVVDLGNIGANSLYRVCIPVEGYYKYGVPALSGHSYISLAQQGEEGNFIVLRVSDVSASNITIDYIYIGQTALNLSDGNSYDFSRGSVGSFTGGDFYFYQQKFWANNSGQRGVKDLGNLGTTPLYQLQAPKTGYNKFGVSAILGHTYISRAQEGQEGNFIAFRVNNISGSTVTITYVYLPPGKVTLADGSSYDYSGGTVGSFTGGDLYFYQQKFWANNSGQNGVLDLGDLGSVPLDGVDLPEGGYNKYGVPAVLGHTYVSLAQVGEEGNYIVFKADEVSSTAATIHFLYLTPNRVTLSATDSYDFSEYVFGRLSGGDFYLASDMKFYANNVGQRGLQDLGDIGTGPLDQVDIPGSGYTRFGVDAVVGHTYVSLAQAGEEGNYIVFRVHSMNSESVTIDFLYEAVTSIHSPDEGIAAASYDLEQNYPNPFNSTTEIAYRLAKTGYVNLSIYNLLGQEVRTLVSRKQSSGRYSVRWNGLDNQGNAVASGIYYYRIKTAGFVDIKKLILAK